MKRLILFLAVAILAISAIQQSRVLSSFDINKYFTLPKLPGNIQTPSFSTEKQTVVYEESIITKVVEEALPSVVTVGVTQTENQSNGFEFNPFNPFSPFPPRQRQQQKVNQNIGSGFIISDDGLIITNKHVVSDTNAKYKVLTNDKKEYEVKQIYRDPLNDMAILKIDAKGLKKLTLGDSSKLKLGQLTIAIGTPLGEFTNTVTTGIVSGLGRGITAGSAFEGYVEKLDNVIQTDAAINPGNSGGPLLNSAGQVIGINTAVAQEGQNIGFALPSSLIRKEIEEFQARGGTFERPIIGVRYQMIDRQTAIRNEVVEGAYVVEVVSGSAAEKAGIQQEDIITKVDGQRVKSTDENSLLSVISKKKVGDTVQIEYWRDGETKTATLTLQAG